MSTKCLSKPNSKNVHFKSSYRCRTCKKSFKEFIIFEGHFAFNAICRAKNGWFIKCYVCGQNFRYLAELRYHIRRHTVQKNELSRNCTTNNRAINNKKGDPPVDGFQCNISQRSCRTKFYMNEHMESHSKETITKKTSLIGNRPVESVGQFPSLECPISSDKPEQDEHTSTPAHEGLRCEICNLSFTTEISLRFHRKLLHSSKSSNKQTEKNLSQFQCEICKAKFTFQVNLTRHKLVHTDGEEECEICHIKFTKRSLELHEKEAHPESFEEQLSDEITPAIASKITSSSIPDEIVKPLIATEIITPEIITPSIATEVITAPITDVAAEIITPPIANEIITSPIAAQVTYCCEQCGRSVSSVHHLLMHLKSHRRYKCDICGKAFSNKAGLNNHSRSHSFECYVCKEDFPSPKMLLTHIRQHCVYEQWINPANVYLSNWSPERSREILQNQPLVMVSRLNVTDTNRTYSVDLDKPKDIELSKVKDEPRIPLAVNPELPFDVDESEPEGKIIIELKHFPRFEDSSQIVDVKGKVDPLKREDEYRALAFDDDGCIMVEQQPVVSTTFNDNDNDEVVDISSESDIDEIELFHCYFCNETFRSLDALGIHVKKCSFCP